MFGCEEERRYTRQVVNGYMYGVAICSFFALYEVALSRNIVPIPLFPSSSPFLSFLMAHVMDEMDVMDIDGCWGLIAGVSGTGDCCCHP